MLQRGFRAADLLRPPSRKAGTFCKILLWSLPSKQMGWSSHESKALLYLSKHLHGACSASGSKVAIKGTLKFGTCGLFTQFRETESRTAFSLTVKYKPRVKSHRLLHTALSPPHCYFPNFQPNQYTCPQPLKGQSPYCNASLLYYLCYRLDLTLVCLTDLNAFFFFFLGNKAILKGS